MAERENSFESKIRAEIECVKASISTPKIVGFFVALAVICIFAPFVAVFLPFVIVALVVAYRVSSRSDAKAMERARAHSGRENNAGLEIVESLDVADSLVLNDWGVVWVRPGKETVEFPWSDIKAVDEPRMGMLRFQIVNGAEYEIDLRQARYTLIIEMIQQKLGVAMTDFDVDLFAGGSNLMKKVSRQPLLWRWNNHTLNLTEEGISFDSRRVSWDEVISVTENERTREDLPSDFSWMINTHGGSFEISDEFVCASHAVGHRGGSDIFKAVIEETIPDKVCFIVPGPTVRKRVYDEFRRCQDSTKAAFGYALVHDRNLSPVIEPRFQYMLKLVDRFSLHQSAGVQEFFMHYSELLRRTGRAAESENLRARIK